MSAEDVTSRVDNLMKDLREAKNEIAAARTKAAVYKASSIIGKAIAVGSSSKIRYTHTQHTRCVVLASDWYMIGK